MNRQKRILVLGGGYYNLPLIKKAVEMGHYTIVCGIPGNYPGYTAATEWVNADVFNKDQVLDVARKYEVNAVMATGADTVMPIIGYVNDRLHLVGPSERCTILSTNKYEMKKRFVEVGVRTAQYQMIRTLDEAHAFAKKYDYSVVLKVVDKCGGVGIAIVHDKDELERDYPLIVKQTKLDYIIIEEYIQGTEFGAQAYVKNGELKFVMPHGDMVYHSLTDIPVGHYVPYEKCDEVMDDVMEQLRLCVDALEIRDAAINADFILSNNKVYVLEIGARPGATCLPELVSVHYGRDYYEYLIQSALGEETDETFVPQHASIVETLISMQTGVIKDIHIGALPKEVVDYSIYPKVGEAVHTFRTAYDRIGTLILRGESVEALKKVREEILKKDIVLNIDEQ